MIRNNAYTLCRVWRIDGGCSEEKQGGCLMHLFQTVGEPVVKVLAAFQKSPGGACMAGRLLPFAPAHVDGLRTTDHLLGLRHSSNNPNGPRGWKAYQ